MSYLVLARKHRPQTFDEVTGQEHITELLKKAVQAGRVAQAYLFCGPRGIGKTSCARILAKSLNCEKGPTLKPCGKCPACKEIAGGTSFDVLEIDGASNRGIDEIRALRENVKFAPGYGRYKIYIVDEVHMLTGEAFNALLKTLEEPPEHVKFIFATTAVYKVPATIISRCQRFDFKRIPVKTIVGLLTDVAKKEKFKIEPEALFAIAKAAQGSLRDALSILDQLSALSEGGIRASDVFSMLGLVETNLLFELTAAVGEKNCTAVLETLEKIIESGKDIKQLNRELIEHFRNLMVIKIGGPALSKLVDYPASVKDMYLAQTHHFSLKDILVAIETLIEAQETARVTETSRMPLEVAFAKLTYTREAERGIAAPPPAAPAAESVKKNSPAPQVRAAAPLNAAPQPAATAEALEDEEEEIALADDIPSAAVPPPDAPLLTLDQIKRCWDTLTYAVSREKMSVATYLQEGIPMAFEGGKLHIGFPKKCSFHKEVLEEEEHRKLLERVFAEKLGAPVLVRYEIVDAALPQDEESVVRDALKTFQGKVVSRWHNE